MDAEPNSSVGRPPIEGRGGSLFYSETEAAAHSVVSLPLFVGMSDASITEVVDVLFRWTVPT